MKRAVTPGPAETPALGETSAVAGNSTLAESAIPPVYLDHAATTPAHPAVLAAYAADLHELNRAPGNPAARHGSGRRVRELLEDARARLAAAVGAQPGEVVFTSGGTEANALAVGGVLRSALAQEGGPVSALAGAVEHPAVSQVPGLFPEVQAHSLRVTTEGELDLADLKTRLQQFQAAASGLVGELAAIPAPTLAANPANLANSTISASATSATNPANLASPLAPLALVTVMALSNETGVIQPVAEAVAQVRALAPTTHFHTDAVQVLNHLPLDFAALGVDSAAISGHKFGAPGGTGALLIRKGIQLQTDRPGGGQERGLRSGTQDVAGARALALAAELATQTHQERQSHHRYLRDLLVGGLPATVRPSSKGPVAPGIVHLLLPTRHPEILLLELDRHGVSVSAGSACSAGVTRPSPALLAQGFSEDQALGVLRISFGRDTTAQQVQTFLRILPKALQSARLMDDFEAGRK